MPDPAFRAFVQTKPGYSVMVLGGEINAFADEALMSAYEDAVRGGTKTIFMDFSDVEYINSTGIALIVGLLRESQKAQRRLCVYGLSDHYMEIFRITRLADFMAIYQDETSALSATIE